MDIRKKIESLPIGSGVYIMKSAAGRTLYIGKATSLKKRLKSHFSRPQSKNTVFLDKVTEIEYIQCSSPEQALILEAALIKEQKPRYNIALRDNKSYPYVVLTKEEFPRIFISRPKNNNQLTFYGPYPKAKTLKLALTLIRRVFPYRTCRIMPRSACLFFSLKLCPAPCIGKISESQYKNIIRNIIKLIQGERELLVKELKQKMNKLAKAEKFEEAGKIRDKLLAIDILYQGKPQKHELVILKELLDLPKIPLDMEAIDISRLGKGQATGSVVVFKEGNPDKSQYRRFLIKNLNQQDDYAMIGEIIQRRYSRLLAQNSKLPDLVIIDGGIGHVNRADDVLRKLGISLPLIGISKQKEEIWFPHRALEKNKNNPLIISKENPALQLIQRIRDEAHRFAHKYQLIRRRKKISG
ncbi:MAG: GIY-YIG nuclease family protein [Candidatus Omnitrophica bacterium]|jgi:excinuclease ABC subunit C|nr:GIY-YIG nuclease family protein [Candidatus Omnitrophota bacterium]